jgi:hypothetical protein
MQLFVGGYSALLRFGPEKTLPPVVPNSIPRHVVVLLRVPD